jgi:uncharacterized protein
MTETFSNLLSPPVLFFFLGVAAAMAKSDLEFPGALAKGLALYLMVSIGLSGGMELRAHGFGTESLLALAGALGLAFVVPFIVFFALRSIFGRMNAAAIAATYGSVSAVTFIAAMAFLDRQGISYHGSMIAAMALMESPAILVGIWLAKGRGLPWRVLMREAALNGSVVLLIGSLIIGLLVVPGTGEKLQPFFKGIFPGVLCLFLLDMGLISGRRLGDLWRAGWKAIVPALLLPPVQACLGIAVAALLGLSKGDALLLAVLAGSASYIAVPAALRVALPEANPGLYLPMALAVTFPFNIVIGIPLYLAIIARFWT